MSDKGLRAFSDVFAALLFIGGAGFLMVSVTMDPSDAVYLGAGSAHWFLVAAVLLTLGLWFLASARLARTTAVLAWPLIATLGLFAFFLR